MDKRRIMAVFYAVLAAVLYAINMPASKILLKRINPTMMAALLYLGAGIGIGMLYILSKGEGEKRRLSKEDLPYTVGMIVLDIAAPVFLMYGLTSTTSANASLLNNFEIVATSIIALVVFKEVITKRLWAGITLITLSSMILSFEDLSSLHFSWGSVFVLLAALCWGFENNCTRKLSSKNTYEIVMLKGIFSGIGSFIISRIVREGIPAPGYIIVAMVLGFVAYGLSIFFYIKAQDELGAAKTSAYYAAAPFVGAFLSFVFLRESLTLGYGVALIIMIAGSTMVVVDTMIINHVHVHTHTYVHTHDGSTHSHTVEHSHQHSHFGGDRVHDHSHGSEIILHK